LALNERTKIREGDRTRSVTKLNALILKMINDSHAKEKVQANLIGLMRAVGLIDVAEEAPQQAPLTGNDDAVIAEYFERNRDQLGLVSRGERSYGRSVAAQARSRSVISVDYCEL
jgi:hypothetical protein